MPALDNTTTLFLTTNDITTTKYLKAALDEDLPDGFSLRLGVGDPGDDWSPAAVMPVLSTVEATLASGTAGIAAPNLMLTYGLETVASAGKLTERTVTVTFTLTDS